LALLAFHGVPALAEDPEARDLVARKLRRARGRADPPLEPRPVGLVDVRQHAPEGEEAELLAHLARGDLLPQTGGDVEETAVGPPVIIVESPDQLRARHRTHCPLLPRAPCRTVLPTAAPSTLHPSRAPRVKAPVRTGPPLDRSARGGRASLRPGRQRRAAPAFERRELRHRSALELRGLLGWPAERHDRAHRDVPGDAE